jgi:hypothetical protein
MAAEYLWTTNTGSWGGGNWYMRNATNARSALSSDNNNTGIQHNCNTGGGNSAVYGVDNMIGPAGTFTSVVSRCRVARSGTTHNSTIRLIYDRDGSANWWYGTWRNTVNAFYNETVTPPGGGWTEAKINAHRWISGYNEPVGTSTKKIYFDYWDTNVNYSAPVGAVQSMMYGIPQALPFLADMFGYFNNSLRKIGREGRLVWTPEEMRQAMAAHKNTVTFDFGGIPCLT